MVAYVVIPGIDGSGEEHWQSLWERRWDEAAVRIAPESWSAPMLVDWVAAIDAAVRDAAARDRDVVLVAHSLGCWAAAAWAGIAADAPPVRAALLVAPPDLGGESFPTEAASTFTGLVAHPLGWASAVVASADDPYCRVETARALAAAWGSSLHEVGAHGHLNSASGLGDWPTGQDLLADLVEHAVPRAA